MSKIIPIFLLWFFVGDVFAQTIPTPQAVLETSKPDLPEDLKNLVWNKWSTENFIIISIDKNQGLYLKNNLEKIKKDLLNFWGINNFSFSGNCKIVCVTDKKMLKRIFRLDGPKFEIKQSDNEENSCVIWFSLEDKENLPLQELMQMCIFQLEKNYNKSLPLFISRGMYFLSNNVNSVKEKLLESNFEKITFSEVESQKNIDNDFDLKSAFICLLIRREYGKDNFSNYIKSNNIKDFGINDLEKFNIIINRYYKNLINDLRNKKTPGHYLNIIGDK